MKVGAVMSKRINYSEKDIAKPIVEHLKELGYDVYQEVPIPITGNNTWVADIIAIDSDKRIHVIECKKVVTFELLCQAVRWMGFADYISIAATCPNGKDYHIRVHKYGEIEDRFPQYKIFKKNDGDGYVFINNAEIIDLFCKQNNLGWYNSLIPINETCDFSFIENCKAIYVPRISDLILDYLHDVHKNGPLAGSRSPGVGAQITVINKIYDYLVENQGRTIREVISVLGTFHYCSDKSAMGCLMTEIENSWNRGEGWIRKGDGSGIGEGLYALTDEQFLERRKMFDGKKAEEKGLMETLDKLREKEWLIDKEINNA